MIHAVNGFDPLHIVKLLGFFMLPEARTEFLHVIYLLLVFKVLN